MRPPPSSPLQTALYMYLTCACPSSSPPASKWGASAACLAPSPTCTGSPPPAPRRRPRVRPPGSGLRRPLVATQPMRPTSLQALPSRLPLMRQAARAARSRQPRVPGGCCRTRPICRYRPGTSLRGKMQMPLPSSLPLHCPKPWQASSWEHQWPRNRCRKMQRSQPRHTRLGELKMQ